MKRKLFSKIAVLVVMLTLCMPISAYAKCPYCDTGSVGELSEQNHRWVTLLGEKIGHAQALYTQLNVRNGYHGIDFDGNPLTLPYGAVGASYEANGKICSETFYVANKEIGLDFKSEVDFEKGTYKRFDGQVYRIDPSLFANAYCVIREDKTTEIQNAMSLVINDLRFVDWMFVNNSALPETVMNKLNEGFVHFSTYESLKAAGTPVTDEQVQNEKKAYYEAFEIALEMLYGIYPMDEQ